ncbi:MAG: protein kinase [Planctomycetota bacterium]
MSDDRSTRLNQAIADILQDDGANLSQVVADHPDLADELHSFAADYELLRHAIADGQLAEASSVVAKSSFQFELKETLSAGANSIGCNIAGNVSKSDPTFETRNANADPTLSVTSEMLPSEPDDFEPDVSLALPCEFGDYELLEQIAFGGMGVVYKARHRQLDRLVAVKMILAGKFATQDDIDRFFREARSAGALDHPAIVPVHDVGTRDGQHYYAMAFVDGGSLAERIADGPLSASEAAAYTRAIADAVQYAHQRGVIHRDLKPSNVLIGPDGLPKITDFGLASREGDDRGMTVTGQILGTPAWMPPEQAIGRNESVSRASDVYSVGAVLFALLTGRPPFMASTPLDTLRQVIENDPVSPRILNPDVPLDLETICLKCLEKDPSRRYESAQFLADELGRFLDQKPILARRVGRVEKVMKLVRRHRMVSSLVATAALILSLGAAVSTYYAIEANARATSEQQAREQLQAKEAEASQLVSEKTRLSIEQQKAIQLLEANQYVARLREAQAALESGDYDSARRLLDLYQPTDEQEDRRCFVWQYLDHQVRTTSPETLLLTYNQDVNSEGGCLRLSPSRTHFAVAGLHDLVVSEFLGQVDNPSPIHRANLSDLAFTYDEKFLFTACGTSRYRAGSDGTNCQFSGVRMLSNHQLGRTRWEIDDGEQSADDATGVCVACSPTEPIMACGMKGGRIAIWNYRTRERLAIMTAPDRRGSESEQPIEYRRLAFSPDGRQLASVRFAHAVDLWDVETRTHSRQLHKYATRIPYRLTTFETAFWLLDCGDLAFSDDGKYLAAAANGLDFLVFNLESSRNGWFRGHRDAVTSLAFVPGQDAIVSGSLDKTVRMWSIKSQKEIALVGSHRLPVHGVAVRPERRQVLSFGSDQRLRAWKLPGLDERPQVLDNRTHIYSLRFLPDGHRLMVGGWNYVQDGSTNCSGIFDTETGERTNMRRNHIGRALGIDCSRDGRTLVSANLEGNSIDVWNERQELIRSIDAGHEVIRVSLRPDARYVAASAGDSLRAGIFDMETGQRIASLPGCSRFSPDGRILATSHRGQLTLRNASSWDVVNESIASPAYEPRFSPDGRRIAFRTSDTSVSVFDVDENRIIFRGQKHFSQVYDYAFAPDRKTLATVSRDQRVLLWDLSTGEVKAELTGHTGDIRSVDFSYDGHRLASGSVDGTVRVWRANAREESVQPIFEDLASPDWPQKLTSLQYDHFTSVDLSKPSEVARFRTSGLENELNITADGLSIRRTAKRAYRHADLLMDWQEDFDVTLSFDLPHPITSVHGGGYVRFGVSFNGIDNESFSVDLKSRIGSDGLRAVSGHRRRVEGEQEQRTSDHPIPESRSVQQLRLVRQSNRVYFLYRSSPAEEFECIQSYRIVNESEPLHAVTLAAYTGTAPPLVIWKNLELRWNHAESSPPTEAPFDPDDLSFPFVEVIDLSNKDNLLNRGAAGVHRDAMRASDQGLRIQLQDRGFQDAWVPVFLKGDFEVSVVVDSYRLPVSEQTQAQFQVSVQFDHPGDSTFSITGRRGAIDSELVVQPESNHATFGKSVAFKAGSRLYLIRRDSSLHFLYREPGNSPSTLSLATIPVPSNAASRIRLGIAAAAGPESNVVYRDLRVRSNSSSSEILTDHALRIAEADAEVLDLRNPELVSQYFELSGPNVQQTSEGIITKILQGEGPSKAELQLRRDLIGDFDVTATVQCGFSQWGRNSAYLQLDFEGESGKCAVRNIRYYKDANQCKSRCTRLTSVGDRLETSHGYAKAFESEGRFRIIRVGAYIHTFLSNETSNGFRYLASHHVSPQHSVSRIRLGIDHDKDRALQATWKHLLIRSWGDPPTTLDDRR